MTPAALGPTCPWCLTEDHPEHGCAGSAAGDPECCKPYAERRVRHGLDRVILDIRRGMSGYAVHAQAWGDVRPEGTATTQASVPAALWKVAKVATSGVDVAELVGSLLAAPVTEPASVAELREAIEAERSTPDAYYGPGFVRHEAARARVDAILARLDVTGPVAQRDVVARMLAEIEDAARIDLSQLVGSRALSAIVDRHLTTPAPDVERIRAEERERCEREAKGVAASYEERSDAEEASEGRDAEEVRFLDGCAWGARAAAAKIRALIPAVRT